MFTHGLRDPRWHRRSTRAGTHVLFAGRRRAKRPCSAPPTRDGLRWRTGQSLPRRPGRTSSCTRADSGRNDRASVLDDVSARDDLHTRSCSPYRSHSTPASDSVAPLRTIPASVPRRASTSPASQPALSRALREVPARRPAPPRPRRPEHPLPLTPRRKPVLRAPHRTPRTLNPEDVTRHPPHHPSTSRRVRMRWVVAGRICWARNTIRDMPLTPAADGQLVPSTTSSPERRRPDRCAATDQCQCSSRDASGRELAQAAVLVTFVALVTFAVESALPAARSAQALPRPSSGACGRLLTAGRCWSAYPPLDPGVARD